MKRRTVFQEMISRGADRIMVLSFAEALEDDHAMSLAAKDAEIAQFKSLAESWMKQAKARELDKATLRDEMFRLNNELQKLKGDVSNTAVNLGEPDAGLKGGWISVDERLPETGKSLLVCAAGYVKHGWLRDPQYLGKKAQPWQSSLGVLYDVTHWRELPPPPAGENK